jgi:hypothetical protein
MACDLLPKLGLRLVADDQQPGFDAIDRGGTHVQIKARRPKSGDQVGKKGTTSSFSETPFDYALLVLLDSKYAVKEIYRADYYPSLKSEIKKRDDPQVAVGKFIQLAGKPIYTGPPAN